MTEPDVAFTDLVSLGYRCRTTRRLRDHFGCESAYPLDWWVTTIKGAIRFFDRWDVDRLYDPRSLHEVYVGNRIGFVRQADYGIKFLHEFPSDGRFVESDWRDHIGVAKSKTAHLMRKLEALNCPDRRVLLCREVSSWGRSQLGLLGQLRAAVLSRLPDTNLQFLLISPDGVAAEGWRSLRIDNPGEEPWEGDPVIWDAALASLGYAVRAHEAARSRALHTVLT